MPMQAQRGGRGMTPSSHNPALEGGVWSATRSLRFTPGNYPIPYMQVVSAARGQSGQNGKSRLRAAQPATSLFTGYAFNQKKS
jgi:hypothetical protein